MKKLLKFLNQPLVIGVVILVATALLQQWGWKAQQRFIAKQAQASAAFQQSQATIDQITVAVGRLLTSYASILGAHEEAVKTSQLNETIDLYHKLQREWDQEEDLLKLRVSTYFPDADIDASWSALLDRLGELDSQIHDLHEFNTNDSSPSHEKQIALCRKTITDIEQALARMTALMKAYLSAASAS